VGSLCDQLWAGVCDFLLKIFAFQNFFEQKCEFPVKVFEFQNFWVKIKAGICREKKVAISVRNPVLGLILANLCKNTAFRATRTPNSGMGNPNLRIEFLFHVDLYVNR
jgi:hypothetical protein